MTLMEAALGKHFQKGVFTQHLKLIKKSDSEVVISRLKEDYLIVKTYHLSNKVAPRDQRGI